MICPHRAFPAPGGGALVALSAPFFLPADLRPVFPLCEAEGLSVPAIARDLSLNPITVKTRLFRARSRLRAALDARRHGGFEAVFPFDGARCGDLTRSAIASLKDRGRRAYDPR